MKMDILKIEDTNDGGAIVTVEVDRDMLHLAFQQFLNQAIMDKVNETLGQTETREVFEEDELLTESVEEAKAPIGFNDVPDAGPTKFWAENPHSPGDHR